jgi:hypothetical protein
METKIMIALVEFLSDQDLVDLKDNEGLLDATRRAAREEIQRRKELKTQGNDV